MRATMLTNAGHDAWPVARLLIDHAEPPITGLDQASDHLTGPQPGPGRPQLP